MHYRISSDRKKGAVCIEANIKYDDMEIFYNPKKIVENNVFKIYKGNKFFDLIEYCDPLNFAISEKLKEKLEENKITGWSCYPIVIDGSNEKYYGFQVTGRAGTVTNLDEDGFIPMEDIEFDINTWDGSDIFNLEDAGGIKVCTPRVKEILENAKMTNIEFSPL